MRATRRWLTPALLVLVALVVLSPAFAWASGAVGYAEPLDNAAEATGATDDERTLVSGVFPDYTAMGGGSVGTLVAGAVGTALTLAVGLGVGRLLEPDGR